MIRTVVRRTAASAAVVLLLAGAAWLAAPRPGTAAAAQARMHCAVHHDHGTSLYRLSRRTHEPVAILLWFAFRCSGYQGGGWTIRMARYLSAADLHAPYRGWWWDGALP